MPAERDVQPGHQRLLSRARRPRTNDSQPSGNRYVERPADRRPEERRWGNADHREGRAVDRQLASDDVAAATEVVLPQPVADYGHRAVHAAPVPVVRKGEDAAEQRLHPERLEEFAADPEALDEPALARRADLERCAARRERPGEYVLGAAVDLLPDSIGPGVLLGVAEMEPRQAIRFRYRQRPQDDADHREDRRARADTDRQRQHRGVPGLVAHDRADPPAGGRPTPVLVTASPAR